MLIKRNNHLLINNNILHDEVINYNVLSQANHIFINGLNPINNILPAIPPVEKHPYTGLFPLNPDYEKYIVGTFPPPGYLTDLVGFQLQYPDGRFVLQPNISFYHGNVELLWQCLMGEAYNNILNQNEKIAFIVGWLNQHRINICDIISFVTRTKYNSQDNELRNIYPNIDLMASVFSSKKDVSILFNTSSCFGVSGIKILQNGQISEKITSFDLFIKSFQNAGAILYIDFLSQNHEHDWVELCAINQPTILNLSKYKAVVKLKIVFNQIVDIDGTVFNTGEKEVFCVFGPSPSRSAARPLASILIYQQANENLLIPMNHANFCSFMYSHFLQFYNGGYDALQNLNT